MQWISAEKRINEIKLDQFIQPEKPKEKRMKMNEKKKKMDPEIYRTPTSGTTCTKS